MLLGTRPSPRALDRGTRSHPVRSRGADRGDSGWAGSTGLPVVTVVSPPSRPIRPVRFRDAPYAHAAVVYAISGLSQHAIEGLEDALAAYVALPASLEFRSMLGKDPDAATIAARAKAAIVRAEPGLTLHQLMLAARGLGFDGLPTRILISGDSVAITVNHGFMDGGPILEYVVWLLSASVGATAKRDVRAPVAHPFRTGLRKVGRDGLRAFLAQRKLDKPPMVVAPVPRDEHGEVVRSTVAMHLSGELVARVTSLPAAGPATASARIASTGVAALARIYSGSGDPVVIVPVDLRRYVGNQRVLGNFMGVGAHSTLRGSSWEPDALTERLVSATADGSAMIAGYIAVLRWARAQAIARLRGGRSARQEVAGVSVFVPLLGVRKGPPAAVWSTDKPHVISIGSIGEQSGGAALNVLSLGDEVHLSVGDESGTFDLTRFEEAFLAEVAAREATAPADH